MMQYLKCIKKLNKVCCWKNAFFFSEHFHAQTIQGEKKMENSDIL